MSINRRISLVTIGFFAAGLFLVSCGNDGPDAGDQPRIDRSAEDPIVIPAGEPIVIGVSAPLTGDDSPLGLEDLDAVAVAVERWKAENGSTIAGHEIVVRAEDDGCTETDIAVQAAENLAGRANVVGVIGPNCSDGARAALPVYAAAGLVTVSGSATTTALTEEQPAGGFFFRTAYRNDIQGALIGLFVAFDLGFERAFVVDDGEAYGIDLADTSQDYMERNGVEVNRDSVIRGSVNFAELAGRIVDSDPQIVIYAGFNPEGTLLYRQLRDAGYDGLFGAGDAAASVDTFLDPVGEEAAEGVLFSGCAMDLGDFRDEFRRIKGYEPSASAFVAQYADAATVLLDAVAAVAEEQNDGSLVIQPARLRDHLRGAVLEDGLSGSIAFDENGDRVTAQTRTLPEFVDAAIIGQDLDLFYDVGLVPCQVQDGRIANLLGPGATEIRLP